MKAKSVYAGWLAATVACVTFGSSLVARGQAGRLDTAYQPNPSYVVNAVAIDGQGKALIGGEFRTVNGLDRRWVARLNTDGTVDASFVPADIDGSVSALVLQEDGKVLIGGRFWKVDAMPAYSVARLQTNGAWDPAFSAALGSFSSFLAFAPQADKKLLVASDDGVVRLMPNGSLDGTFQRLAAFQWVTNGEGMMTAQNSISCLSALADGKVLAGGSIQAIAGRAVGAGLIRLNANGGWDETFRGFTNGAVSRILVQPDGRIVIGRNGWLARLNADGTPDTTFEPASIAGDVMCLARQADGKIIVGGYFEHAGGLLRRGVARFHVDGTLDVDFDAGDVSGFSVGSAAVQPDGRVVIGGYFTKVNGLDRPYVARLQADDAGSPGRFEFLSTSNSVVEAGGNLVIPVCRYGGTAGSVSVVVSTEWGSALPDVDYLSRTSTLVFASGQASNYFSVPIVDDSLVEGFYGWEAFSVKLSAPTGGATLGSEKQTTAYILEDDTAIGFAGADATAYEAAGEAVMHVVRSGMTNTSVSASFQTQNGTAVAPGDYTATSGTIGFQPGETEKTIIVPLIDDDLVEDYERFSLRLSAPTGGASLGTSNVTVHVTDDVSFVVFGTRPTVIENDGQAVVTLYRWGRTNNAVSVRYATSNLSAAAGVDYLATVGTLTFLPGVTNATITIPIVDDSEIEGAEQFQVTISEPSGTLVLVSETSATVSIISDDGAGSPDNRFKPVVGRVDRLALCPGGRILALAGSSILAFNPDGSADAGFQPISEVVDTLTVDAQGRVYVCNGIGINRAIRRLEADGTPDTTFDPFYVDYMAAGNVSVWALAVQADGKLIVSASPAPYYGYESATNYVNRLNEDGSYDLSFGPVYWIGNEVLTRPPSALAVQVDGRMLMTVARLEQDGVLHNRVVRLTERGQLDPTFSRPDVTGELKGIYPLANGNILITGSFTSVGNTPRLGMAMLQPDGALDGAFNPPFQAAPYFNNIIYAAAVEGGGKIVFCGNVRLPGSQEVPLGRLNADGSWDTSFQAASSFSTYLWDVALQGDGKVLVAGSSGPYFGYGVERLNNDVGAGAGSVEFSAGSRAISETNTAFSITVRRGGGTNGVVKVRYSTSSGTAKPGMDFVPQTGVIEFAAGESSEKDITVSLLDDTLPEGNESFGISLGRPLGGATWGASAAMAVTIIENEIAVPPLAHISRIPDGRSLIQFSGTPKANYRVMVSWNLIDWEVLGTATEAAPGQYEFSDSISSYSTGLFYRVRWP